MSGKSLALKEARTVSLFPSESEWAIIKDQATTLVRSGLLPKTINTPEKAIAIAIKGRELGIPMMQAFSHIFIIDGKPGCSSELMHSLINRNCPGAVIDYIEKTDKRCEIEVKRPGRKAARFSFTIEDARRANLLNKDNWKMYPVAMLIARAVAQAARNFYPDAVMGMGHLAEELGAETNEDGQVISVPSAGGQMFSDFKDAAPVVPDNPQFAAAPRDPKVIGREINVAANKLGLTAQDVSDWVQEEFQKPKTQLGPAEMEQFLTILQREVGLQGAPA